MAVLAQRWRKTARKVPKSTVYYSAAGILKKWPLLKTCALLERYEQLSATRDERRERAWRIGGVSLTRKTSHVDNAVLRGGTGEQRARAAGAALHAQNRAGASADCGSNSAARHAHWALAAAARARERTVAAAAVLFPLLQRAREPAEK
jgi:hypothetical protein